MRRELPQQLLRELLKNSKRSDRELAKVLQVSQPTITRVRHRLEENGMIKDYTITPNFRKMGFELMTITFVKLRSDAFLPESMMEAKKYATTHPETILTCLGEGLGMNGIAISFHKDYTEYHRHLTEMRTVWKDFLEDIRSFIIPIGEGDFKRFSLTHLKDVRP